MEKQVSSIVHEAYARKKGEFFVKKARAVFHRVTNNISFQKDLKRGHCQKRCRRVSELSLQKLH